MRAKGTIWHDQLFFILLAVSLVCFGLTRFMRVRVFALPATILLAPRAAVGELFTTMSALRHENERLSELVVRQELDNGLWRDQAGAAARESLSTRYRFQKATVVGRDPQSLVRTLIVDRGLLNGVRANMAAITDAGIAGKVVDAGANLAYVATVLNPRFKVAAMNLRSRVAGVVGFREKNLLSMDYVLPEMDMAVGDTIITSGTGGIFPKGLRVGTIARVDSAPRGMFRRVDVKPAVNIAALERVYLIEAKDWDVVQRRRDEARRESSHPEQPELQHLLESSLIERTGGVSKGTE
jgi:rod shape-determining protein MreC